MGVAGHAPVQDAFRGVPPMTGFTPCEGFLAHKCRSAPPSRLANWATHNASRTLLALDHFIVIWVPIAAAPGQQRP